MQDCIRSTTSPIGYTVDTIKALDRLARKIKAAGMTAGYTCIVNKHLPRGKKPGKVDVRLCTRYFQYTVKKCEPKFIVPLGSTATNVLTGKSKFRDWAGRLITVDGYKVVPMYHPDYAVQVKSRQREFESQQKSIIGLLTNQNTTAKKRYRLYTGVTEICERLRWLVDKKGSNVQSFDYETTHLEPDKGVPVCLSVSYTPDQADVFYFFDIEHWRKHHKNPYLTGSIKKEVRRWMKSDVPKVAQNAKFEFKWTDEHFGCEPNNIVGDTKQIHHLFNEDVTSRLTDLAYQYTDMGGYDTPMQEFLDEGHEHWECPPDEMLVYSGGDSDCTRQIYMKQKVMLEGDRKLTWLYDNIVHPAVFTLGRIEQRGMKIDYKKVEEVSRLLTRKIERINKKVEDDQAVINTVEHFQQKNKKITSINLNSAPQMQWLLYKELDLPVINESKKTKQPKTDAATLELLKNHSPIVKYITQLRSYAYQLTDLQQLIDKRRKDDTIYSDLVQDYVVTGRLSSRNPNLQNIKLASEDEPSYVKQCFVSRFAKGNLLQADFKQLELRLMGSEAREPKFIRAFERGDDMHQMTADEIGRTRLHAKRVNFGSAYGITKYGLAVQLGTSVREAGEVLDAYWLVFTSLKKWMRKNEREALRNLQVRNRFGRIRHLPEITSSKWWLRESAERQSSNFKIQSLGADINMWSMVRIDTLLTECEMESMVIGQIHDSVLIDVHPDEREDVIDIVRQVMEDETWDLFDFLNIELLIDIEIGERWSELEPLK